MILQVGVKVFLKNKDGKYLLLKRSAVKYPDVSGLWDIVGGRIDTGTTLIENLKREVREETQLEIISEPRLIAAQDIMPNPDRHIVRLSYIADTVGEPILDTTENVKYRWLSLSDFELRNVIFNPNRSHTKYPLSVQHGGFSLLLKQKVSNTN